MEQVTESNEKKGNALRPLVMNYELLADLFYYPESKSDLLKTKEVYKYLCKALPEAAEAMQAYVDYTELASISEIQELFLRSFDLQAITTLDIGFVLFGEDYKRGKLLVHLNQEHREVNNDCHNELSDHLPNILNLLPKMKDESIRNDIATMLLMPAIEKMIKEFSTEKIEKKDEVYKKHQKVLLDYSTRYRTVYQTLLQAAFIALKKDFDYESEHYEEMVANAGTSDETSACHSCGSNMPTGTEKDFVQNIETEMLTEKQ
ncbi:MAG: hypothetical protein ABI378_13360 [Chitinophagaceae bacterium]